MSSKKWCLVALLGAVAAFLTVIMLNIFVDPFGVFGDDWYSYNATNNPRIAKIEYLKENHQKYDSYVIGCSSTSSYPVEELNKYLDANFYNMIMYGADMYDVEKTVYYLADNYTVENIVLNVYIANGFDYDYEPDKMTGSMHSLVSGESKVKFYSRYLFANPEYSFAKIKAMKNDRYLAESFDVFDEETGAYDKRKRDAEHISDMEEYYKSYPIFANYPVGEYPLPKLSENAESIGRIKSFCDERGIKLLVVNAPIYSEYFECIPKEDLKKFYEEIAKKVDFWDFSMSSVSFDARYFYDETHFRNDVGRMALARVFGDDSIYIPEDFGTLVTKENVSSYVDDLYGKTFDDSAYTKKLPVLLYHHISENVENDMIVSPEKFEADMKAISDSGYAAVTLDNVIDYIEKGVELPENPVMITFDDGYMSNFQYAYPILEKYGLKGVIFAVGETYGRETYPGTDKPIYPHFSNSERDEMNESGVIEVECHTYGLHQSPLYGGVYENILIKNGENEWEYVKRLKNDIKKWSDTLGYEPKALAFPHGISDLLSQSVLNELGIKLTFSTVPKTDTLIKGISLSGYALGRYTITETTDVIELIK